uniref:Uncharacterized protein n=1 Tax=Cyanoderma ruficeps TaxID=181631 RepID=A0A8C3QST5_9PASS
MVALTAETTCPLCLDMLVEPVLTACGHSFCRRCLATVLGYPLHSLGNVAGQARALEELAGRPPCPQHAEPLVLFCTPCAALICTVCRDGSEHQQHRVLPAEVAAPELRVRGGAARGAGGLGRGWQPCPCGGSWAGSEPLCGALQWTVIWDTQHVAKTFDELQKFVKEQQKILLGQLNELSRKLVKKWDGYNSRILERRLLLDTTIAKIQEKQDQRVIKFLMVRLRPPLSTVSPGGAGDTQLAPCTSPVTLDPETAGPFVALSQDCKTIRCRDGNQNLPDISKKFTSNAAVLGSQGFTSGRHYWEVEVEKEKAWAVGWPWDLGPATGLQWPVQNRPRAPDPLKVTEQLWMIRVHLDHDAGQVTFYNAENMKQIVQFRTTFTEKVFPYFCLYAVETQLWLCD